MANDESVTVQGAALDPIDARVYVAIVDAISTATYPGIKTPRGYALRSEVEARLADLDPQTLYNSLQRLHSADKIGHYYDRDGCRYYLKGTR